MVLSPQQVLRPASGVARGFAAHLARRRLLGPNGAGKTTLVKMLVGLVRPDSGEAVVLGAPLGRPEARREIGYLPELFRYQPWLNVAEVLELHACLRPIARADRPSEIRRVLALAGLADRAPDRVGSLSKGLQQRLGLAVALLGHPRLLLLDEPTSALDPTGRCPFPDRPVPRRGHDCPAQLAHVERGGAVL